MVSAKAIILALVARPGVPSHTLKFGYAAQRNQQESVNARVTSPRARPGDPVRVGRRALSGTAVAVI